MSMVVYDKSSFCLFGGIDAVCQVVVSKEGVERRGGGHWWWWGWGGRDGKGGEEEWAFICGGTAFVGG